MSFESDINEILFLLKSDKERREHDFNIIVECLNRMKRAYEQNIQQIAANDTNGTRPEDWNR